MSEALYTVEQQSAPDQAHLFRVSPEGVIVGYTTCSHELLNRQPRLADDEVLIVVSPDVAVVVDRDWSAWRAVDGAIVAREAITPVVSAEVIAADGQQECVISGLPDPCRVRCSGAIEVPWTVVTGGVVALTMTEPGTFAVRVAAPPAYQPWEGQFRAD